ncbi:DUF551 domain-containing protein [Klebsiella pneumoniae]
MALAAMDSESGCLPLDYLQGHKDGMEWAAQLAEANHPETGDWLYDDPIELAKAIRKGPDMPPVQPVADSEPVAWTDEQELRDVDRGGCGYLFTVNPVTPHADERRIILLYRHAQPALVVPDVVEPTIEAIKRILPTSNPDEYAACIGADMWNACRAAMRQELKKSAGTEAICRSDENVQVLHTKSPAQSDCCPAQNQGWIPVSERMPDENAEQQVLACFKGGDISTLYYFEGRWDDAYGIVPIRQDVTHWMPLPAAPQEAINVLIPLVSRNEREVK